jgi:hypothetical protein
MQYFTDSGRCDFSVKILMFDEWSISIIPNEEILCSEIAFAAMVASA